MKVLFINSHYYIPQSVGGMAVTLDQLCRGLAMRGHSVCVLAGFRHGGTFGLSNAAQMKLRQLFGKRKIAHDRTLGYSVWRAWEPEHNVDIVCTRERPDVIVVMGGRIVPVAEAARRTGIPIQLQVHDVEM